MKDSKYKEVNPAKGTLVDQKEYVFETDGTNLRQTILLDGIDHRRTISNDICEVYKVMGIEAARQCLLNEIRLVLRAYDIYVNFRHLALLCDAMCVRGYIMPINRNGINRVDVGPLRKCSFEETLDMLLEAAAFSQTDPLTGVSENVMLGQLCRLGTGCFDLVMDPSKFKEPKYIPDQSVELPTNDRMEMINIGPGGMDTPMQLNTPAPGNYTPTPRTTYDYYDSLASFTPVYGANNSSPGYSPSRMGSPEILNSGAYGGPSPGYILASPIVNRESSPTYSPGAGLQYNPTSPHYSTSNSPSMSSGSGSVNKTYSPLSPSYSITSPKYSPSYSPRSPNYSSAHASNTPSSQQNPNTSYTPNSPAYARGMNYNPVSPAYEKNLQSVREDEGEESQEEDDEEETKTNKK